MRLKIDGNENGTPKFDGELSRVNVILGTNGSGKSKLLDAFAVSVTLQNDFRLVRVSGARRGAPPENVSSSTNIGKSFEDFDEQVREDYVGLELANQKGISDYLKKMSEKDKDLTSMTHAMAGADQNRVLKALQHFSNSLASERVEYTKRHLEWMANGGEGDPPKKVDDRDAEQHLGKLLSLFSEIFPDISITAKDFAYRDNLNVNNMQKIGSGNRTTGFKLELSKLKGIQVTGTYSFNLTCAKNGHQFSPENLSDGEKQILSLLADRYFFKNSKCAFLVDEPELNLDPVLAIKYWNLIEREMPTSTFVYTTHSLDFALRDNVNRIWSLGRGEAKPIQLETLGCLPTDEQRRFLSGIRGIITTDKGLVVEGTESSFDSKFYPWILGDLDNEFQISGYGSCNDVQAATKKLDIWQLIVPQSMILGIIDADYKTEEEIGQLAGSGCISLKLHDAESYLCHPELLLELAAKMERSPFPTQDALIAEIIEFLDETMLNICHHRLAQRCRASVQISLRSEALAQVKDFEELKKQVSEVAVAYAGSNYGFDDSRVKEILSEERRRCVTAKSSKDVMALLNLVKGKDLLAKFAKHFGLANGFEVMNYVAVHLSPESFSHTDALREQIKSRFKDVGEGVLEEKDSSA